MLTIAGIVFYLAIFTWLTARYVVRDNQGLTGWQVATALVFKTLAGCLYGYIFLANYGGDDTWQMHAYSIEQQEVLRTDPWRFFTEFLPIGAFGRYADTGTDIYYYLHDLEAWLIAKPFALINFITGANYYVNLVFYNALVFFGHYWLFVFFRRKTGAAALPLFICIFLVPPVVFWLSGMRADGLLLFFLVLLIGQFDRLLGGARLKNVGLLILAFGGLIILRSIFAVLIVPGLIAWALVRRGGKRPGIAFIGVYGIAAMVFLGSGLIPGDKSLTMIVAERQRAFLALEGNTRFELPALTGEPESYFRVLPRAIANVFFRPLPFEAKGPLQMASSAEILLVLAMFGLFLLRRRKGWKNIVSDPAILCLLFFGTTICLLIGFTVPFPGAIVRYRIIPELFLLTVLTSVIDWQRIPRFTLNK